MPAEVKAEESTAQRSSATGYLLVSMPKCNPELNVLRNKVTIGKNRSPQQTASKKNRIGQEMIYEANESSRRAVCIEGLVKDCKSEGKQIKLAVPVHLEEVNTKVRAKLSLSEDGPPPLL